MMQRMQQANAVDSTDGEQEVQGKGDWQQKADLNAIFSNGSTLSSGLMAKYENLMPGVSLGQVSLHQGSQVDAALQTAGLHGLTDGTNVAVASTAPSGTLEHELGHVGQRQEQGFSLDEGNRQAHEKDADEIAGKLLASQPVERFEQTASAKKRLLPSQMLEARMMQQMQARCAECGSDEQQALSEPMALDVAAQDETQAKATGIEQAVSFNEISKSSNIPVAESSPKLQAAAALAPAGAIVFGPVAVVVGVGIIAIWLNNGGWQKIGEITDVLRKGIEGTLQELREILNRAGEAARNELDRIEDLVRQVFMSRKDKEKEGEEEKQEEESEAKPSKADCTKAIKLLTQYERLMKEQQKKPQPKLIEKLNKLRESGEITSYNLSGTIQSEFPGSLKGKTLNEIRKLCRGR